MGKVLSELKSRVPKFLEDFDAPLSGVKLPDDWNDGEEFVTRQVICKCSNEKLVVVLTRDRSEDIDESDIVLCDPIYIKCPKCSSKKLLFSSIKHGYDGEYGHLGDEELQGEHVNFADDSGRVFVNVSFQGEDNYKELIDEGIVNPEDYFDTLTIYFESDKVECVESFECA